ncbi:MAG: hypothetical protein DMG07_20505 [Acidobacteria bacterium]|nr:MAG: hypothetical protein DMG07_20505 [Acidobacteriota bacterium]
MAVTFPGWVEWTLRVVAWAGWQLVVLFFALVVYGNLFSEYGIYSNRFVDPVAAVVLLTLALWLGTWLPVRKWVARHRSGEGR